jgi:hypothetical protein
MPNTSADGGYLTDQYPKPPSAEVVQHALQEAVAVLAGLPGNLVRPRWQPLPPVQPPADITWVSIGVVMVEADNFPSLVHVGGVSLLPGLPPGYEVMQRHQTITVEATFYGPEAEDAAGAVRDALHLPSNIAMLAPVGLKLREVHDLARAPELLNQQWVNRIDLRIDFRQMVQRVYAVLDLDGADVSVTSQSGIVSTASVRPAP